MNEILEEFEAYLEHLAHGLGHADRHAGLKGYCAGLVMPLTRKSVEPIAAHLDPQHVSARHQSLHHFVAKAQWSDAAVMQRVREWVLPALAEHAASEAGFYWIIDDTGFPKKGRHSVGVARQYCGQLGKQDNCQVAVSLSLATQRGSLPIAYQLYVPKEWADDPVRRHKTGIPEDLVFATKPQIALTQLRQAVESGIPAGVVLADAGYGDETAFRDGLTELGLLYAVGVRPGTSVWAPGVTPLPPKPWSGRGKPAKLLRRAPGHEPVSVKALAMGLPDDAYQSVAWREGSNAALQSRFAAVRIRPAHRDYWSSEQRPEEWLLIEWPKEDAEPLKYFLSTAPADATIEQLVFVTKMRWRIERDYQDLKQECGLGHYEGRGWRGFHHHATLSIAAYGYLMAQRLSMGSADEVKKNLIQRPTPAISADYVPRGSPTRAAPHS
ncbi:IS701 family transposase [Burkholderia ubonensis]|uniref:IS701 family transposase n=1 Tax=Burkholderia ubonensis TaxID=101571 RepID=UPI0007550836|nr:IS701 family transposase [Burkholderia ubonensis]KWK76055.1 DDE endonuclease [Burkholderia ubonensis]